MFPSHLDGGFHTVGKDDELRWPAVVKAAETHDVDLSHSGRKIARKLRGEQGALKLVVGFAPAWLIGSFTSQMSNVR